MLSLILSLPWVLVSVDSALNVDDAAGQLERGDYDGDQHEKIMVMSSLSRVNRTNRKDAHGRMGSQAGLHNS